MKKKTRNRILFLLIFGVTIVLSSNCKKSDDNNNNPSTTVSDKDENVYHTVTIGTQTWMVENLRTTKFNDGTSIPLVTDSTDWNNLTTPGYCWYNNDANTYKNTYGALYNWFTVNSGKLCPPGWHIPTYSEWETLINYLGGSSIAGAKMKTIGTIEAGTGLWYTPNEGATNESGFSAVPSGYRYYSGNFLNSVGRLGYFWSGTEHSLPYGWGTNLYSSNSVAFRTYGDKRYGFSARCMKNN
ncbi:MAG: fibrobacter succinogenes major paralogous domain-containing protein [Bacteroidales bacterium]|jgi:uncharacterized protein (TIGR02145 family)|nr:fibrobacter succinogenes major paralogous domain-containing protein [Bacteroidales bacterium]